jgi:hypothetical protein
MKKKPTSCDYSHRTKLLQPSCSVHKTSTNLNDPPNYNPWSNTQKNQQKTELQCQDFQIQKPKLKESTAMYNTKSQQSTSCELRICQKHKTFWKLLLQNKSLSLSLSLSHSLIQLGSTYKLRDLTAEDITACLWGGTRGKPFASQSRNLPAPLPENLFPGH